MESDSDNSSLRQQTGDGPSITTGILMTTESQDGFSPNSQQVDLEAASSHYGSDEFHSQSSTNSTASLEEGSPLKRHAEDDDDNKTQTYRPFKRKRGGILSNEYLDLLNESIEAVSRPTDLVQGNLAPSQLGLTYWSVREKELFFHALARYGRLDLPKIAATVGTKSVIEVNHYIDLLQEACDQRRHTPGLRPPLVLAEYPAALELSQACCHAQDGIADGLSSRIERREQLREEGQWGRSWDITPALARMMDADQSNPNDSEPEKSVAKLSKAAKKADFESQDDGEKPKKVPDYPDLPSAQLFHLSRWLQLSRQIFMNSAVPVNNWHFVDDTPPSMWATTFEDFQALAVSYTRRLVQATLFVAMSRIRSQKADQRGRDTLVRSRDVEAAIASLGVSQDSWEFWQKAPRRLRLDVFQDPPANDEAEEGGQIEEPTSYDKVERYLMRDAAGEPSPGLSPVSTASSLEDTGDEGSETTDQEGQMLSPGLDVPERILTESENAIHLEALEILEHSAVEFPETRRVKDALYGRIAMERQQEDEADRLDEHASRVEELNMWKILHVQPPMELPKPGPGPGPPTISDRNIARVIATGKGWKETIQYEGEWESMLPPGDDD